MDLQTFFTENPSIALGFSGGVDSSYLLYAALKYGANIRPYFVKTDFQPEFELKDALDLAEHLNCELTILKRDISPDITDNPPDRCYYCKKYIFGELKKQASKDGFSILIDGTNASDDFNDRPGMRALSELSVLSPLRECGITKGEVRRLSKAAGLFTWNKHSYACLATRIPTGMRFTPELLRRVELSEDVLFSMGFTDFRVRVIENSAKIQFPINQMPMALEKRAHIIKEIQNYFSDILMDMTGRPESDVL